MKKLLSLLSCLLLIGCGAKKQVSDAEGIATVNDTIEGLKKSATGRPVGSISSVYKANTLRTRRLS